MEMISDMCVTGLTDVTSELICLLKSAYTVYVIPFRTFPIVNLREAQKLEVSQIQISRG